MFVYFPLCSPMTISRCRRAPRRRLRRVEPPRREAAHAGQERGQGVRLHARRRLGQRRDLADRELWHGPRRAGEVRHVLWRRLVRPQVHLQEQGGPRGLHRLLLAGESKSNIAYFFSLSAWWDSWKVYRFENSFTNNAVILPLLFWQRFGSPSCYVLINLNKKKKRTMTSDWCINKIVEVNSDQNSSILFESTIWWFEVQIIKNRFKIGMNAVICRRYSLFSNWFVPSKPLTLDHVETFDVFFRRACYHWNASNMKIEENKSCRKTLDLQIRFCSFFVHDSSTDATELARKNPKFPWGPKLEPFTVSL